MMVGFEVALFRRVPNRHSALGNVRFADERRFFAVGFPSHNIYKYSNDHYHPRSIGLSRKYQHEHRKVTWRRIDQFPASKAILAS